MGAVPNLNPSPFATLGSSKHGLNKTSSGLKRTDSEEGV